MKSISLWSLLLALLFIIPSPAAAAPISPQELPEVLRPWIPWVLHGQEQMRCPFLYNNGEQHSCIWPSRLELRIKERSGRFSQEWLVFSEGWIPLPGDGRHWPQEVRLDDQPALVSERQGMPGLFAEPGSHTVSGSFSWERPPEALQVPVQTGLIALFIKDAPVILPDLDANGRLWLGKGDSEEEKATENDRLELKVHRRIVDEIPMMVTTRMELQVSGRPRELVLGRALLAGTIPMSLNSPLPARVEPDGRLRLQVRPGQWVLEMIARYPGPVHEISLEAAEGPGVEEEVWVFEARNHLRLVTLEGATVIDPQQTTLPEEWRRFPAFRLVPGERLRMVEGKRGDPDPSPDQLALERRLWLDFQGKGYTIQDRITGTMTRGWRLEMKRPALLGRVGVDGQDQFITRLDGSDRAGVEVRRGRIQLIAESRLDGPISTLPAVGWEHDFQRVSGELNLPPGWRLVHASGVDHLPNTWIKQWTLMDLFFVLIVALALAKLFGWGWGLWALVCLGLTYHEPWAPRWVWMHTLIALALLRVLPAGRIRRVIQVYRFAALVGLVVILLPFMGLQIRQGLYPQLEAPHFVLGAAYKRAPMAVPPTEGAAPDKKVLDEERPLLPREAPRPSPPLPRPPQIDPHAVIQTGPGLPQWRWTTIPMRWSGPVERRQEVHLSFISPAGNLVLAFVRVLLLCVLVLRILGVRARKGDGSGGTDAHSMRAAAACMAAFLVAIPVGGAAGAEMPPEGLLNELRKRLLEKPECLPQCATSPILSLELTEDLLRGRMEIHSQGDVAVPLPGHAQHWLPRGVTLNGKPAAGLMRQAAGHLWIQLPRGRHQILLEGPLPARETVLIPLLLKPRRVEGSAEGWIVEGLHENGVVEDQIQLRRLAAAKPSPAKTLQPGLLPPFVRVERTLLLGLTWEAETRVVRLTPPGSAVVMDLGLLEGESVTTEGVRVEGNRVLLNMPPNEMQVAWRSALEVRGEFRLRAPERTTWSEVWRLDVSPIWHVTAEGIPVIHHQDPAGRWLPEWRPWPGEMVSLRVARPEGVPGKTLTMDQSLLAVTPGQRAIEARLDFTLRSSRGGEHKVNLPEAAILQAVSINGKSQPIRQEGHSIRLPLVPGSQKVDILWREAAGITSRFHTPSVDMGVESVNANLHVNVPGDRWVLLVGGPLLGPAVLFWGVVLVILLVSFGLGRTRLTPLRMHHWSLLGLGLSLSQMAVALPVVAWLLALGQRRRLARIQSRVFFDAMQVGLASLTLAALLFLFYAIREGLLGHPEMWVAGNGSSSHLLRWYQDRASAALPQAWLLSLPMTVYRVAMLAWALWLAVALLRWLRWGWSCFSEGGLWHPLTRRGRVARGSEGPGGAGPQEEIDPRAVDELEVVEEEMERGGGNDKGPGRGAP